MPTKSGDCCLGEVLDLGTGRTTRFAAGLGRGDDGFVWPGDGRSLLYRRADDGLVIVDRASGVGGIWRLP